MRGRLKREGINVYLWLIHVVIWQKSTQYCKAIILQLKINLLIEKEKNRTDLVLKGDNGESDPLRP